MKERLTKEQMTKEEMTKDQATKNANVKEQYQAALEVLRRSATPLLEALAAQPASPLPSPDPPPPKRVPRKKYELLVLVSRLRALGGQELLPGLTGSDLAAALEGQLEGLDAMEQLLKYLEECSALLTARAADLEAEMLPGALEVFHEARRLAQIPGKELEPVVRVMQQTLRSQHNAPRGKRRRR